MQNLAIHQKQTMVGKINWKKKKKSHVCEQVLGTGNFEYSQRKEWEPEWVFEQNKKKGPWLVHLFFNRGIKFLSLYSLSQKKAGGGRGKEMKGD